MRRHLLGYAVALFVATGSGTAWAQQQAQDVEVEPITCWWRASSGFIRVGEPFSLALTCAVVETESTKVVPDQSRLDASVMALPPFEVTGGGHGADVRTASHRFFQYEYRLRLVAENLFGADATVPPLQVTYHVETRASGGEPTKGRDLTYQLPALPIRVSSLVPDATRDIREAPGVLLTDVDRMRARANTLRLVAGLLMGLGALLALAALVSFLRRRRPAGAAADASLSPRSVLSGVTRTLVSARQESQQSGWSPELAGKALAALRIAASYAIGRPVGQRPHVDGAVLLDGQLVVGAGWPVRSNALVSGAVTAESITHVLGNGATRTGDVAQAFRPASQLTLEELRDALSGLTIARYTRRDQIDTSTLDDAVASGLRATERLAAEHTWIAETRRAMSHWTTTTMGRVWKR
jgi:hypothetical protein